MHARYLATLLGVLIAAIAPTPALAADTRPEFVVGILGDSYASGEGTPDTFGHHDDGGGFLCPRGDCFAETWWAENSPVTFPQGDDAGWDTETLRCHRSSRAPGPRALMRIQAQFPDVKVVGIDFACSGATIVTGVLRSFAGTEPSIRAGVTLAPAQVAALRDFVDSPQRTLDAVVVNIGGNDAHFGAAVADCLFSPFGPCSSNEDLADRIAAAVGSAGEPGVVETLMSRLSCAFRTGGTCATGDPRLDSAVREIYLTSAPDATHAGPPTPNSTLNPENFCDLEGNDPDYARALLSESRFIFEDMITRLNSAFDRAAAAADPAWIRVTSHVAAFREHGICADDRFFRTLPDALRIQGNDFPQDLINLPFPVPFLSSGIAHPNGAGYQAIGNAIAAKLEQQVHMRFTPPALRLLSATPTGFTPSWQDPSPLHPPERTWDVEIAHGSSVETQTLREASLTVTQSGSTRHLSRTFVRPGGQYTVRVRGCRAIQWCGPFSNAITFATVVPGTPTGVQRLSSPPGTIRIGWTPGPNTPSTVHYQVLRGRYDSPCSPGSSPGPIVSCAPGIQNAETVSTTATTSQLGVPVVLPLDLDDTYGFQVRACSAAGCSAYSPLTLIPVDPNGSVSPAGTFGVYAPRSVQAGRAALIQISWRSPRRWTDLDRVDVHLRTGGRRVGLVRFSQDDGVLYLLDRRGQGSFGHPEEPKRLRRGPFALDLARSTTVRFGPKSKDVILRLAIVPSRALRGRTLTLRIGARNDLGRSQRPRLAGSLVVR